MLVVEAKDLHKHPNVWQVVNGSEIIPCHPAVPAALESTTTSTAPDPLDPSYVFQPQSTDSLHLTRLDNYPRN